MSTDLVSPLAEIIKRAATQTAVEGPAARLRKRFEGCSGIVAVLLDVSGSMQDTVGGVPPILVGGGAPVSRMTKWDHLQYALRDVMNCGHTGLRLIAFGAQVAPVGKHQWEGNRCIRSVTTVDGKSIDCKAVRTEANADAQCPAAVPIPCGGTPLDLAIQAAVALKPRKTIIISDGLPDSPEACVAGIEALTGAVDTIYCGPDADPAVQFLRSLARAGAGTHVTWDGYRQASLGNAIRGLLPAPV